MHLANSFFHCSFGLFSQFNWGKHIHVSFWTSVSLAADTAIINTMWQISVDIVWKKKKPSNCLLVCFPYLPSCDFSLPCCGSRWCFVHGSLQICWEEAKVRWSCRCKGWCVGDEMWRWDWPLGSPSCIPHWLPWQPAQFGAYLFRKAGNYRTKAESTGKEHQVTSLWGRSPYWHREKAKVCKWKEYRESSCLQVFFYL